MEKKWINKQEYVITDTKRDKIKYIGTLKEYETFQRTGLHLYENNLGMKEKHLSKNKKAIKAKQEFGLIIPEHFSITEMKVDLKNELYDIISPLNKSVILLLEQTYGKGKAVIGGRGNSEISKRLKSLIKYTAGKRMKEEMVDFILRRSVPGRHF